MRTKLEKRTIFEKAHVFPCKYKNLNNIPHWHREHELILVEAGSAIVMFDGNLFTLSEGMGAFLHSGTIHSIASEEDSVTVIVKADEEYFSRLLGAKKLVSPLLGRDYELSDRIAELFYEFQKRDEYSGILTDCIATKLIADIFRGETTEEILSSQESSAERYKELLDLITRNYAYMTFEDAAGHMHFSRPYFSKYFLEHSGMTFTRYLNMIKVSHAVEKIQEGQKTVTEISQSCGFNTIRNFNRVFKDFTGYTPNRLPKSYQFIQDLREYTDNGFDPTLNTTEILMP